MIDDLGDRMKMYESAETSRKCMPGIPIMARLDGRSFSKFTRGLRRPYDPRMTGIMQEVTKYLVEQTNANVGYTQSDEITLTWRNNSPRAEMFFGGKYHKLVSILAAMATARFNQLIQHVIPEKRGNLALFDCRVWQVPSLTESTNAFVWRVQDAKRNAVQMVAQNIWSHEQLQGASIATIRSWMYARELDFDSYPREFTEGTFFLRIAKMGKFSTEEILDLPEKHHARSAPDAEYVRHSVELAYLSTEDLKGAMR